MEENKQTVEVEGVWGKETVEVPVPEQTTEETPVPPTEPQQTTEEPPARTEEQVQEKVVEVEKIVEKVVEKYPEFKDDYSKSIFEALVQGKDEDIKNYLDEKYKDYTVMSDVDVVRERLKKENPTWTDKDITAEIRFKYGKNFEKIDLETIDREDEPEKYDKAIRHNEEVERRELMLERDSRDARGWLNERKKTIELPKIPTQEPVKEEPKMTPEQIEAHNRQWQERVTTEVSKMPDFSWKVGDEEVSYKLTKEDKDASIDRMKNFSDIDYLTQRGWYDENGNMNPSKIAEDVYILENISKILASTGTQMKQEAKKEIIANDIKQIDLSKNSNTPDLNVDIGESIWK